LDIDRVKEVKIALIRRGWNQGDLADSLGISQSYLSLLLKGRKEAPWIWKRIDEELGITGTGKGAGET
jgi:transcriptional regulator with XRE-family HTH domain